MSYYLIKYSIFSYIYFYIYFDKTTLEETVGRAENQYSAALPCRAHQGLSVGVFMRKWFSSQGVRKKRRKISRKSDYTWVMTTSYSASM